MITSNGRICGERTENRSYDRIVQLFNDEGQLQDHYTME